MCKKSNQTLGQTDLLEDLVGFANHNEQNIGMSEREGDNDEIEIGSDYPYAEEINKKKQVTRVAQVTSTNTSSLAPVIKHDGVDN
jgi:hypothetical protein